MTYCIVADDGSECPEYHLPCEAVADQERIERRRCPNCGIVNDRPTYDIGSGPELCCLHCDWCWGYGGQELKPYCPPDEVWS